MNKKRKAVHFLLRMMGESYWEAPLKRRMERIKAQVKVMYDKRDYRYEEGG